MCLSVYLIHLSILCLPCFPHKIQSYPFVLRSTKTNPLFVYLLLPQTSFFFCLFIFLGVCFYNRQKWALVGDEPFAPRFLEIHQNREHQIKSRGARARAQEPDWASSPPAVATRQLRDYVVKQGRRLCFRNRTACLPIIMSPRAREFLKSKPAVLPNRLIRLLLDPLSSSPSSRTASNFEYVLNNFLIASHLSY